MCPEEFLKTELAGKTVLVTGGSEGIGFEVVKQLSKQNATVVIASRDEEKTKGALKDLQGCEWMKLDLSELESVRYFAKEFKQKFHKLDILCNNAAVMKGSGKRCVTNDGRELMMATNYLGHFLLTELLKDSLKAAIDSRIICVSSCAAEKMSMTQDDYAKINMSDIYREKAAWNDVLQYGASKLANYLHAKEFAKREPGVTTVALHPGWALTPLMKEMPFVARTCVMPLFGKSFGVISVQEASQVHLYCCLAPVKDLQSGAFYSQKGIYTDPVMAKGALPFTEFNNPNINDDLEKTLFQWSLKEVGL